MDSKADTRKEISEKSLKRIGVTVDENLPSFISDEDAKIRTLDEIARRAVCAFLTAQIAIDIYNEKDVRRSCEFFGKMLDKFDARGDLTADEAPYFDVEKCMDISREDAFEMQWRIERCMPLFNTLGVTSNTVAALKQLTEPFDVMRTLQKANGLESIIENSAPLNIGVVLSFADVHFRLDHACKQARELGDPDINADFDSDVVNEQFLGYCWLVGLNGSDNWDSPGSTV